MDPSTIAGAIFDVGNVLLRLRPLDRLLREAGIEDALRAAPAGAAAAPVERDDPLGRLRHDPILDLFERGRVNEEEFLAGIHRSLVPPGARVPIEAIRRVYRDILGEPEPGMEELIRELRRRRIRAVGLTNISRVHLAQLQDYPAVLALERVVASCDIGFRKPEPEAYQPVLDFLGAPARRLLFIDDRAENVDAARRLGLQGHIFDGAAGLRAALGL